MTGINKNHGWILLPEERINKNQKTELYVNWTNYLVQNSTSGLMGFCFSDCSFFWSSGFLFIWSYGFGLLDQLVSFGRFLVCICVVNRSLRVFAGLIQVYSPKVFYVPQMGQGLSAKTTSSDVKNESAEIKNPQYSLCTQYGHFGALVLAFGPSSI